MIGNICVYMTNMKSISKRGEKQSIKRLENVKKLMRVISKLDDDDFKALSKHLSRDAYDMIFQSVWNSLQSGRAKLGGL
jgi:cytochrome c553